MKIIFSRKGFDSKWGGVPSPIMPDGRLCSLPIPTEDIRTLCEVRWRGQPLSNLVEELTNRRHGASTGVHLDPDLRRDAVARLRGWLPTFGQVNAAQRHLENQGVGVGDLFLFFGWFRQTTRANRRLFYNPESPQMHVLFGWLQVGQMIRLADPDAVVPGWAGQHPHVVRRDNIGSGNTLYIGRPRLRLRGTRSSLAGAGVFTRIANELILTAPGQKYRSLWRLPEWFLPRRGRTPLTYHMNPNRWNRGCRHCTLQTVAVGQEFVFDTEEYPEAEAWLRQLFAHAEGPNWR